MFLDGPERLGDLVEQGYAMPPKALSDKMQPLNLNGTHVGDKSCSLCEKPGAGLGQEHKCGFN